jgi:hypothetical protein
LQQQVSANGSRWFFILVAGGDTGDKASFLELLISIYSHLAEKINTCSIPQVFIL